MNNRIFNMMSEKLTEVLSLSKYQEDLKNLNVKTDLQSIEWTPARLEKFKRAVADELCLDDVDIHGTFEDVVDRLDKRYLSRYFGEMWKPETEKYQYSGWGLVDLINKQTPKQVLDFGCGFNQFKGRIDNLVGIDPYNNCADYMVDILDFNVEPESFDHIIVFGSLNFNSYDDIEIRFQKLISLLMPNGRMYFRVNPGHSKPGAFYVDIFPWTFEIAYNLAKKYNMTLEKYKVDNNDRLYFEMVK